jgi:hypothetical protein
MRRRKRTGPLSALALAVAVLVLGLAWWALDGAGASSDAEGVRATGADRAPARAAGPGGVEPALPPAVEHAVDAFAVAPIPQADVVPTAPAPTPERGQTGRLLVDVSWPDGTPAADVGVRVAVWDPADPHPARLRGRTDAAGRFVRDEVPALTVTVHADRGASVIGTLAPQAETVLALPIPTGLAVVGHVRDADGQPVGAATVWLLDASEPASALPAASTDAQGRFKLAHVASGRHVGAIAPGHTPSPTQQVRGRSDDTLQCELQLGPPGGALCGTVTDEAGVPIEGAAVRVSLRETPDAPLGEPDDTRVATPAERRKTAWGLVPLSTDAQGRFELEGLSAGPITVRATAHGRAPLAVDAQIRAGERTGLTLALPAAALVRGTVRDASGLPVAGATIAAALTEQVAGDGAAGDGAAVGAPPRPAAHDEAEVLAYSGPDGVYLLWAPPLGDARLTARFGSERNPHAQVSEVLAVEAGAELTWDPVLELGARLQGRVVRADGEPAALLGLVICAQGPAPRFAVKGGTDSAGRFSLVALPDAPLTIEVHARDAGKSLLAVAQDVLPGGDELLIVLPGDTSVPAGVRGRVVDEAGRPLPAAEVVVDSDRGLRHGAPRPESVLAVDPGSGAFQSGPLAPGRWQLDVRVPADVGAARNDGRRWRTELLLAPGEWRDVGAIELPLDGALHLTLRLPAGVSLGFHPVRFERILSDGTAEATAGSVRGTETTLPFPPGDYRLRTGGPGLAQRTVPFTIASGATTELELELTPGTLVRTQVVLPDGTGASGLRLTLLDNGGSVVHETSVSVPDQPVDGQGTVQATFSVAPGVYRAQFARPGRPVRERTLTVPALADVLQTFLFRLD